MPLFLYIYIFLLQYIHSYNHSLITFAETLLHIFLAAGSWPEPPWVPSRFELGPALLQASALPSELRCTLKLRGTLELRCTFNYLMFFCCSINYEIYFVLETLWGGGGGD
jgi:hypothetical protein